MIPEINILALKTCVSHS